MKGKTCIFIFILISTTLLGQLFDDAITWKVIANNLNPTAMTMDHHGRVWLAEKNGKVTIIDENQIGNVDPVIKIDVDNFNERGLLGIALHPDLDNNPYLYLHYTVKNENHNRVSRFILNGDFVIPESEEILIEMEKLSGGIHNGGALVFDNKGMLYIAIGDGGKPALAQEMNSLFGKILRIGADGKIPVENPFYEELQGNYKAIWSLGHRNPFNLSYDTKSDLLYSTDVGAGDYEEINIVYQAKNYGWPLFEGPSGDTSLVENLKDPIFFYPHDNGCAIVGLHYYNPIQSDFPLSYNNKIFYGDYCEEYINIINCYDRSIVDRFGSNLNQLIQIISRPENGNILILTRGGIGGGSVEDNTSSENGTLIELEYIGEGQPRVFIHPEEGLYPAGEVIWLTVKANGTRPMKYSWYLDEQLIGQDSDVLILEELKLNNEGYNVYCVVENKFGIDSSNRAVIKVIPNTRPTINILYPESGSFFKASDTVAFSGTAWDKDGKVISNEYYHWVINLHHNEHFHPLLQASGINNAKLIIPTTGETDTTILIRATLLVADNINLESKTDLDIFPELGKVHIEGFPGARVNVDGKIRELPYSFSSLKNLQRTLMITPVQYIDDNIILIFNGWEDGISEPLRIVTLTNDKLYITAKFDTVYAGEGTGLIGSYYNDPEFDFDTEPEMERVDSIINFNWRTNSPMEGIINKDLFTVRWEGFILPYFKDSVNFYTFTDDGVRLWVDDTLIIDDWNNHPPVENKGNYFFKSNQKIPILMEYFEKDGGARAELKWEYISIPKEHIPSSQMFPIRYVDVIGSIWIDKNENMIFENSDFPLESATVLLFDAELDLLVEETQSDYLGNFKFSKIQPGDYYIALIQNSYFTNLIPIFGVNNSGFSSKFTIGYENDVQVQFIYIENKTTSLKQEDKLLKVNLYPNPVENQLTIEFPLQWKLEQYKIYDITGRTLEIGNMGKFQNINFEGFDPGVYLLALNFSHNAKVIKKIIKL